MVKNTKLDEIVGYITARGEVIDATKHGGDTDPGFKDSKSNHSKALPTYSIITDRANAYILPELTKNQRKILAHVLINYSPTTGGHRATMDDLGKELGMPRTSVYRAVRPLIQSNILIKIGRTWLVNPHVGWRGSRVAWKQSITANTYPRLDILRSANIEARKR